MRIPALLTVSILLTSCIPIPALDSAHEQLLSDTVTYLCVAQQTNASGALEGELTPAGIESLIETLPNPERFTNLMPPSEIEAGIQELTGDPVQLALFLQALAQGLETCGNTSETAGEGA